MSATAGPWWLMAALLLPLALAAAARLPGLRRHGLALLPLAPLPALAAALLVPEGTALAAPGLLLGAHFSLEGHARLFLGGAAFLWCMGGLFAHSYLRGDPRADGFAALWCLTLAGNLTVLLAADVVSFYLGFACVSLAAYPLVVHMRDDRALRAGRVYIVLALAGETALLAAFMLAAAGAQTLAIADLRTAIAASPRQDLIVALLVAGFGIKAGLVPLHVWLPLAHPAAPTPASAVLSGAIVKAGIVGLLQFLPYGGALAHWHVLLLWGGLATACYGVAVGLAQHNPKTVLAYSTVSQMGLVMALLGSGLQPGAPEAALAAASFYALHHGLAKGALFLGVGVAGASGARLLAPVLAVLALPALSLAGLPLSGGALAKLGAKGPLGGGAAEWVFTLSAVGTALLMLRFLLQVAGSGAAQAAARPTAGQAAPWLATVAASLAVPWLLFAGSTGLPAASALAGSALLAALWPAAVAGLVAAIAWRARWQAPPIPEGDLVAPATALWSRLVRPWPRRPDGTPPVRHAPWWRRLDDAAGAAARQAEHWLSRWSIAGVLLLAMVVAATL